MAWLKFDVTTPEKPEVLAITVAMGWDDPDLTVGKLLKVWRWFDQHTIDGNAKSVTPALLDRLIGVTGLTQAIADSGWLVIHEGGLTLPNFETHNGKTAKDRALTASRVAKSKTNGKGNAPTVSDALPREEKRREEKKNTEDKSSVARATRKCPESFVVTPELSTWAATECPLVDVELETAKLRDHTYKTARSDWVGAWRNWLRTAQQDAESRTQKRTFTPQNKQLALEERNRAVADEWLRNQEKANAPI